ncbi:hypothetical protein CCMA1212_009541 [Trichoderma ghanense]|uniref:Uncharacterized protein n=1 Tax=Trichoderma ghanense TaxID=65468 RepID=A0ABY2GRU9_9HYPO
MFGRGRLASFPATAQRSPADTGEAQALAQAVGRLEGRTAGAGLGDARRPPWRLAVQGYGGGAGSGRPLHFCFPLLLSAPANPLLGLGDDDAWVPCRGPLALLLRPLPVSLLSTVLTKPGPARVHQPNGQRRGSEIRRADERTDEAATTRERARAGEEAITTR